VRVFVPAALDTNDNTVGWAVLRGVHNPPMVVALCSSRELADEVYQALGGHKCPTGGVWIAPAIIVDDDR
jgi:hypothetical protein